jgi:hypothetical protein
VYIYMYNQDAVYVYIYAVSWYLCYDSLCGI